MKSIQSKILLVVISGLLVITAVVSAIAVTMTHEIMHKDADRILENATEKYATQINDVLGDMQKSAAIMEHYASTEIESLDQLSDMAFRKEYLQKTNKMFREIALNTKGIEGFFMRLNPEYTDSKTGYYNVLLDDGAVKSMKITDLSKYQENDTKNVSWYYTAVREGAPVWLEPYYFPGYETQLISYTVPLYIDSELLGVIGFDMEFGYLIEKINDISVYQNGYAVLRSNDGKTVYNNEAITESKEQHTHSAVRLINGMSIELRADYKDIQREIRPMLHRIVTAFLVVLFFSILYTVVVTYRIVRPLKQLTDTAEKIAGGVNNAEIEDVTINSKDEIGTLSKVLTSTYRKIQEYTTYIDALAHRDSLTGVKNSTSYAEVIAEVNKEINLDNPHFGVLVADINNLKETNDKYGHDVGNELIIHTAKILTETFKTSSVFRIGGDEFAVLLKGSDYENYRALLVSFDDACSNDYISVYENKLPISIARGVSIYDPEIDVVYEDVFAKADHAMYLNKQETKLAMK